MAFITIYHCGVDGDEQVVINTDHICSLVESYEHNEYGINIRYTNVGLLSGVIFRVRGSKEEFLEDINRAIQQQNGQGKRL